MVIDVHKNYIDVFIRISNAYQTTECYTIENTFADNVWLGLLLYFQMLLYDYILVLNYKIIETSYFNSLGT